jgi:hypothetical protein
MGKWRIVKMPDYTSDYPDMIEPAYILFDGKGGRRVRLWLRHRRHLRSR